MLWATNPTAWNNGHIDNVYIIMPLNILEIVKNLHLVLQRFKHITKNSVILHFTCNFSIFRWKITCIDKKNLTVQ